MRWGWAVLGFVLMSSFSWGQETSSAWRPISSAVKDDTPSTPRAVAHLGTPKAARLGVPIVSEVKPTHSVRGSSPDDDPLLDSRPNTPSARLGSIEGGHRVSGITLGPVDDSPEEAFNWGTVVRPWDTTSRPKDSRRESYGGFLKHMGQPSDDDTDMGGGGSKLASDCDFQNFISPTTNPFLAEDPRKLTEIRPIFLYQTIPKNQSLYRGGNIQVFSLQGRLGLTERFSVVLHKLGLMIVNPTGRSMLDNEAGITEIWLGPKYTFYRNSESGSVFAAGAIFQIPIGPKSIYQDTGNFGIVPYLTGAQKFGRSSFGQFTVMDSFGYDFGTDKERSNYFYNSLHLDYDIANLGRFFPLIEFNYFRYTSNGTARPSLGFEGRDLANVGSHVKSRNNLSAALGMRFKISQAFELGLAGEFPLNGTKDLLDFRFGIDFIWRY